MMWQKSEEQLRCERLSAILKRWFKFRYFIALFVMQILSPLLSFGAALHVFIFNLYWISIMWAVVFLYGRYVEAFGKHVDGMKEDAHDKFIALMREKMEQ